MDKDIDIWKQYNQTGKFDLFGENIDIEEAGGGSGKYEGGEKT